MLWCLIAVAFAKDDGDKKKNKKVDVEDKLQPGELWGYMGQPQYSGWSGTAYTVPKGLFVLHPFIRSGFAVTDNWDMKLSFLGELAGPHLDTEYAFVQNDEMAASVEARIKTPWSFSGPEYMLIPHFSFHLGETVMMDLALQIGGYMGDRRRRSDGATQTVRDGGIDAIRPEINLDIMANEKTWVILALRSNLAKIEDRGPQGTLGAYVAHGGDTVGVSAGLNVTLLGVAKPLDDLYAQAGQDPPNFNVPSAIPLPLPHFQLWIRI